MVLVERITFGSIFEIEGCCLKECNILYKDGLKKVMTNENNTWNFPCSRSIVHCTVAGDESSLSPPDILLMEQTLILKYLRRVYVA